MRQKDSTHEGRGQRPYVPGINMAAFAMRGLSQIADMQFAATRLLLQTQARAATSLGLPDCSDLFSVVDDRAKQVFTSGAEQLLNAAEQAGSTLGEVQRQIGRLVETQAVTLATTWQRGLEELGAQAEQGLEALSETTRRQAEEAERAVQSLAESAQESMSEARGDLESEGDEEEVSAGQGDGNGRAEGGNGHARESGRSRASSGRRGARAR